MNHRSHTRLIITTVLRCHRGCGDAAALCRCQQRRPATLSQPLLTRKPIGVRIHKLKELMECVLARAPTAHLLDAGRNPLELCAACMQLAAGLPKR